MNELAAARMAVLVAEDEFYRALRRLHEDGPEPLLALVSPRAEVSTMNAAGGYEVGPAAVAARWRWWAGQGRPMPAHQVERLSLVVTADLACSVVLEDHGDRRLRVTHLWAREEDLWRLVHRHADRAIDRA